VITALLILAGGCGGDGAATGSADDSVTVEPGDGDADRGEQLASDRGCRSCHQTGGGGLGPSWDGLYGSTVTLDDGTTVLADEAYLVRAITDPGAEWVDGYAIAMPENSDLSDADVADLVAYIRSLADGASSDAS
jgi:cytochrome c oxidase subunit 2